MNNISRIWPQDAAGRVPYWVYSDPEVFAAELDRIWYGPNWLYCALEAEIPVVGDYRTTTLGARPVIVVRSAPDEISVVENRCAHRGVKLCQARGGHVKDLLCGGGARRKSAVPPGGSRPTRGRPIRPPAPRRRSASTSANGSGSITRGSMTDANSRSSVTIDSIFQATGS